MGDIKLSKKTAEDIINSGATQVRLKGHLGNFWTKEPIKYVNDLELVYIQELGIHVKKQDIKSIEYKDKMGNIYFIEIDWEE